ncbi:uncharacterized protein METZ01_LOCUS384478, partial [marine metagenome]
TEVEMCFRCREPLSVEEQGSEYYVINQHCPYCYSADLNVCLDE